jgi:hypothetical protein
MTQLKKMLFIGAIAIGTPYTIDAYYNSCDNRFDYDYALSTAELLNFTQCLRQNNSIKAEQIAQWLEEEIAIPFSLTETDIKNLSCIAANSSLSIESKIKFFHVKMTHSKNKISHLARNAAILLTIAVIATGGLITDQYTGCFDRIKALA